MVTFGLATYPPLTEEAIAEARKLIGVELRRYPRISRVTRDIPIGFARSIGSRNPLYMDEAYASGTFWGCLTAHPTTLYAFDHTIVAPKLPGIHTIYAGTDWEFSHPVRVNDAIKVKARLVDVVEKRSTFAGRMVLQLGEVVYTNQHEQIVARALATAARTPRNEARERGKYNYITRYQYTREELDRIWASYEAEEVRGNRARYWEDVKVGDELTPVVKGPLVTDDMNAFVNSALGITKTFRQFLSHWRRHPADAYIDPDFNMPDGWEASLLKDSVAREFGFPGAHDTGYQRICWTENMITNWMSDYAFLRRLNMKILLPNIRGDTTWSKGRVAKKYERNREMLVDLEVWCENQRGEKTADGTATVAMPSRRVDIPPPVLKVEPGTLDYTPRP